MGPAARMGVLNAETAVKLIERRRQENAVKEVQQQGPVACGISLDAGTCLVNHCIVRAGDNGPALKSGDTLEMVDGHLCSPSNVSFLLHNGPPGSRAKLVACRSSGHRFECEVVRQHGKVIGALFSLEEAVTQSQEASAAVTGVARSIVDRHLTTVSNRLVQLGGVCASQEAALSARVLALEQHTRALEDDIATIGLGEVPEPGGPVDALRDRDALQARVNVLEAQAAAFEDLSAELAEIKARDAEAREREVSAARSDGGDPRESPAALRARIQELEKEVTRLREGRGGGESAAAAHRKELQLYERALAEAKRAGERQSAAKELELAELRAGAAKMRKSLDQAERAREDAAADAKQAAAKHARALDDLKSQLAAAARERDAARERVEEARRGASDAVVRAELAGRRAAEQQAKEALEAERREVAQRMREAVSRAEESARAKLADAEKREEELAAQVQRASEALAKEAGKGERALERVNSQWAADMQEQRERAEEALKKRIDEKAREVGRATVALQQVKEDAAAALRDAENASAAALAEKAHLLTQANEQLGRMQAAARRHEETVKEASQARAALEHALEDKAAQLRAAQEQIAQAFQSRKRVDERAAELAKVGIALEAAREELAVRDRELAALQAQADRQREGAKRLEACAAQAETAAAEAEAARGRAEEALGESAGALREALAQAEKLRKQIGELERVGGASRDESRRAAADRAAADEAVGALRAEVASLTAGLEAARTEAAGAAEAAEAARTSARALEDDASSLARCRMRLAEMQGHQRELEEALESARAAREEVVEELRVERESRGRVAAGATQRAQAAADEAVREQAALRQRVAALERELTDIEAQAEEDVRRAVAEAEARVRADWAEEGARLSEEVRRLRAEGKERAAEADATRAVALREAEARGRDTLAEARAAHEEELRALEAAHAERVQRLSAELRAREEESGASTARGEKEVDELRRTLRRAEAALAERDGEVAALREEAAHHEQAARALGAERRAGVAASAALEASVEAGQRELERLKSVYTARADVLERAQAEARAESEARCSAEAELAATEARRAAAQQAADEAAAQLEAALRAAPAAEAAFLREEVEQLRRELSEARASREHAPPVSRSEALRSALPWGLGGVKSGKSAQDGEPGREPRAGTGGRFFGVQIPVAPPKLPNLWGSGDRPVESAAGAGDAPPPSLLRTNRTRRVLHPVLIGHAASGAAAGAGVAGAAQIVALEDFVASLRQELRQRASELDASAAALADQIASERPAMPAAGAEQADADMIAKVGALESDLATARKVLERAQESERAARDESREARRALEEARASFREEVAAGERARVAAEGEAAAARAKEGKEEFRRLRKQIEGLEAAARVADQCANRAEERARATLRELEDRDREIARLQQESGLEAQSVLRGALADAQAQLEARGAEAAELRAALEEKRRECNSIRRERAPWSVRPATAEPRSALRGGEELHRALRAAEQLAEERTAQVRSLEMDLGRDTVEKRWEREHSGSEPWDNRPSDRPTTKLTFPDYPAMPEPIVTVAASKLAVSEHKSLSHLDGGRGSGRSGGDGGGGGGGGGGGVRSSSSSSSSSRVRIGAGASSGGLQWGTGRLASAEAESWLAGVAERKRVRDARGDGAQARAELWAGPSASSREGLTGHAEEKRQPSEQLADRAGLLGALSNEFRLLSGGWGGGDAGAGATRSSWLQT